MKERLLEEQKWWDMEQREYERIRNENLKVLEEKEWKLWLEEERIEREKEILRKEKEL